MVAGKIVVAWRRKGTKGFKWKVDFANLYDSVDLAFLWLSMRKGGFLAEWISWIWRCVTSHSFLVLVNRRAEGGWIQPQRGMR